MTGVAPGLPGGGHRTFKAGSSTSIVFCVATLLAPGCAKRAAPYHFRSPLVTAVTAPEIQVSPRKNIAVEKTDGEMGRWGDGEVGRARRNPNPPTPLTPHPPTPLSPTEDGATLADKLRGLVGTRDAESTDVQFALRAVAAIGADIDDQLERARSGRALVKLAADRNAKDRAQQPLLGDLVVFDRVVGSRSSSLVGVVVSSSSHGTVEFVYLARGVVRRGYVNPIYPRTKRDEAGRALNTFVRHSDGRDPKGTQYLAGRLWAGTLRLDQLVR